jgi:cytochrome c oxidase subunit III
VSDLAPSATRGSVHSSLEMTRSTAHFGVIVFLASDVMLFAAFFAAYFLLRATDTPWPPEDVELDDVRAGIFTAVLFASSFTLVGSDRAAERLDAGRQRRWLIVTFLLGAAFLANQIAEYATLAFTPDDHPYGSIYWLLTGLHSCHVTAGLVAMALLFVRTIRARSPAAIGSWTGGISLFWHLVDVVWLFLFATIWLIR